MNTIFPCSTSEALYPGCTFGSPRELIKKKNQMMADVFTPYIDVTDIRKGSDISVVKRSAGNCDSDQG